MGGVVCVWGGGRVEQAQTDAHRVPGPNFEVSTKVISQRVQGSNHMYTLSG